MILVYIHGASATPQSFNYIRSYVGMDDMVLSYDSAAGFANNLDHMKTQLKKAKDIFFIAHSLGGVYALHLANAMSKKVIGAVTLSTPYGGSDVAEVAKYFLPYSRLMKDIGPTSWAMKEAKNIQVQHPWCNIVNTTGTSPWIAAPNDGVVTVSSQTEFKDRMDLIEISCNHYEVVLNKEVVDVIKNRVKMVN